MIRNIPAAAEALFASGFRAGDMEELMIAYEMSPMEAQQICVLLESMAGGSESVDSDDTPW